MDAKSPLRGSVLRAILQSGTGIQFNLGGYFGLAIGWVEGLEVNLLGAVAGLDVRRPAIKLPGLGRLGFSGDGVGGCRSRQPSSA